MITRIWQALALAVILWSQGCTQRDRTPASAQVPKIMEFGQNTVLEVPAHQMRQSLANLYRLKPDRRFILSFGELHYYLRGGSGEAVALAINPLANSSENKWKLKVAGREAGQFNNYPKFEEVASELSGWARNVTPQFTFHRDSRGTAELKAIKGQLDYFLTPYLFTGLRLADQLWAKKEGDVEVIRLVAEMITCLYLQTPDLMEVSDILAAKSLALISFLKTYAREPMLREEALLAKRMGYEKHALSLARNLPEDDEVRLFLLKQDEKLKSLANAENTSGLTRFLWFQRLAELGQEEEWENYRKKFFDYNTAIVSTVGTSYGNLTYQSTLTTIGLGSLMDSLDQEGIQKRSMASSHEVATHFLGKRVDEAQFKSLMTTMNQYSKGPFLDKRTFSSYVNSSLQSQLFYSAEQELQKLYNKGEASFRAPYVDPTTGDFSRDLSVWYSELYRHFAKLRIGNESGLSQVVFKSPIMQMGLRPSLFVYRLMTIQGTTLPLKAVRFVVTQLDSRPSHLFFVSEMAGDSLNDVELAKEIDHQIAAVVEISPLQKILNLKQDGKLQELVAIAKTSDRPLSDRLQAVQLLLGEKGLDFKNTFRSLLKTNKSWDVYEVYIQWLEKTSQLKLAETSLREFLKNNSDLSIENLKARVSLVRILESENKKEEAESELATLDFEDSTRLDLIKIQFRTLENTVSRDLNLKPLYRIEVAYQKQIQELKHQRLLEIVSRPTLALMAKNKFEEASRLLEAFHDVPDVFELRALKSELHWAKKEWREAAQTLSLYPYSIDETRWATWIVPYYEKQVSELAADEKKAAFDALANERLPENLLSKLAQSWDKGWGKKKAEPWRQFLAKKQEGKIEEALEVLAEAYPKEKRNTLSIPMYSDSQFDLLWSFISNPDEGGQAEYVWLLRTAALLKSDGLKSKNSDSSRLKSLKYFYSHEGSSHYFSIGRHLMGMISEQQVLSLGTGDKQKCELSYFLGLKADIEGRMQDATSWYRVALETEQSDNSEFVWARKRLSEIYQAKTQFVLPAQVSVVRN